MKEPKRLSVESGAAVGSSAIVRRLIASPLSDRQAGNLVAAAMAQPTVQDCETTLKVLRWLRDEDNGLHPSWFMPLMHICGVVRGVRDALADDPPNAELSDARRDSASPTK